MATTLARGLTEIRFQLPAEEVSVLDGYCSARGGDRTAVYRQILKEWSDQKKHEAVSICRVAGVNPFETESGRDAYERSRTD